MINDGVIKQNYYFLDENNNFVDNVYDIKVRIMLDQKTYEQIKIY